MIGKSSAFVLLLSVAGALAGLKEFKEPMQELPPAIASPGYQSQSINVQAPGAQIVPFNQPQQQQYDNNVQYAQQPVQQYAQQPMQQQQYGAPQQYTAYGGQYGGQPGYSSYNPNFGYKDPGFSIQSGIEGVLIPSAAGVGMGLPFGMGHFFNIAMGLILPLSLIAGVGAAVAWYTGYLSLAGLAGVAAVAKESARSYVSSSSSLFSMDTLNTLTHHVNDALDKYNELVKEE